MGKTKRNASRWMETRFKLGDTQYPKENETHYFNGRYQVQEDWADQFDNDDWYDENMMGFDYGYDSYPDWDY